MTGVQTCALPIYVEYTREVHPTSYPNWSSWKKKEVYNSSDVNSLLTLNGPAQAGADVTDYAAAAATAQNKADSAQAAAENYTNIREQAMIDGVITDAEQDAINAAAIDATNKANAAESAAESAAQIYTEGWSAQNADVTGSNTAAGIAGQGSLATLSSVDWNSTLDNIPARVSDTATTGLNLTDTYIGYYDGTDFKTYIQSNGNFHFGGTADNFIDFNGTQLVIDTDNFSVDGAGNATFSGNLNAAGGTFSGTLDASSITSGLLSATYIDVGSLVVRQMQSDTDVTVGGSTGPAFDFNTDGSFSLRGKDTTGGVIQDTEGIKVYDSNGTLRVKLGKL